MEQSRLVRALGILGATSVGLLLVRCLAYGRMEFGYMVWNLLLATMPLLFVWLLLERLKTNRWSSDWICIVLSLLWLGFLPNSFYIVTDLIHLAEVTNQTLLYDSVMMFVFSITGFTLGYAAVIPMHQQLRRRLKPLQANSVIGVVFLLCSFAIFLGRYMRWNTWDILANPAGLIFDVSDSFVNPRAGGQVWSTTLLFFCVITALYMAILQFLPTSGKKLFKRVK